LDTLRDLKMAYPQLDSDRRAELESARKLLEKEKSGRS
jgi:hypothetical protein